MNDLQIADGPGSDAGRCWAEVDLGALGHNLEALGSHLGGGTALMAVVKANAYGHGLKPVARFLCPRVAMFGVANLNEALELLDVEPGLIAPGRIHILGPVLPSERAAIVAHRFLPAVSSLEEAAAYSALALGGGPALPIHLVIDTGMGRIGVWEAEAVHTARAIAALAGVQISGVASHLPVSDEDDEFTRAELERFHALAAQLRALGLGAGLTHVENSAGIIGFPAQSGAMARAGLALYGCSPRPEFQSALRQVLTWKTRVSLVREVGAGRGISYGRTFITPHPMRIATLAVGYADGYRRHLSGRGAEVLLKGRRCPVLGRVTMDQILVDVSALPGVEAGQEAVLLGTQDPEHIAVAELAQKAGTIPWEILTGLGPRVARLYRH